MSTLFGHSAGDAYLFERETLVFGLFIINPYQSREEKASRLRKLREALDFELAPWIKYYPWTVRPPAVQLLEEYDGQALIYGELVYGEYETDLWLLSSILFNFSSRDSEMYIRMFNQDGEFLLQQQQQHHHHHQGEKAGKENWDNRVWVNQQMVKVVPQSVGEGKPPLEFDESLAWLDRSYFLAEPLVGVTEGLRRDRLGRFPQEALEALFMDTVAVSEETLQQISASPIYMCNAAVNAAATAAQLPEPISGETSSPDGPSTDLLAVQVRFNALAHLYLREASTAEQRGRILSECIKDFGPKPDPHSTVAVDVDKYNAAIESDPLQIELINTDQIKTKYAPKEPPPQDATQEFTESELRKKATTILQDLDDTEVNKATAEVPDDPLAYFRQQGIDIDEDDFFEFFCQEALKMSKEDLGKMAGPSLS